jgi:uncharacterized protein (DUF433 family)
MRAPTKEGEALRLFAPRYSFAEADRLAHASRGTTQRWLLDYVYRDAQGREHIQPPVTPNASASEGASFIDLVEIVAIGRLKQRRFSLHAVREIVLNCQEKLGVARPLATLQFKTGGRDAFVEQSGALVEVGRRKGQRAWDEVLSPFLETLDYAEELALARRWWPLGKDRPIVVDPDYGFGLPVIDGSGVRTEIILERYRADDSEEEIARDFHITPDEVNQAIRFETNRAA